MALLTTQLCFVKDHPNDEEDWIMMYDFLLEYAQEHETCQVPLHYEYLLGDGTYVRLGLWLNIQNQMMINSKDLKDN